MAVPLGTCPECGTDLRDQPATGEEIRQVFDLPPIRMQVTEYRAQRKVCPNCGRSVTAGFPADVCALAQYGSGMQTVMSYPLRAHRGNLSGPFRTPPQCGQCHWFDVMFHRKDGPHKWANARLVRYADDFVVMARYQGLRIDEWLDAKLEGWLGPGINREKTKVVNLGEGGDGSLDFLGLPSVTTATFTGAG